MIKNFFSEASGQSMMRLISFMLVAAGIAVGVCTCILAFHTGALVINGVLIPADVTIIREMTWLTGVLISTGVGGKFVQKFAEREVNTDKTNNPQN